MHQILVNIQTELAAALSGLNAGQTQLHPIGKASGWTIQQIVEHLRLTYASTTSALTTRNDKGHPTKTRPTTNQRIARFVVVTLGLMPGRHNAPPEVLPTAAAPLSGEQLLALLHDELNQLDAAITHAEALFASAPCMSHFVLGPLSASEWRRFHRCHTRHHIRQIDAARSHHRV